jgi:hypothetical protein
MGSMKWALISRSGIHEPVCRNRPVLSCFVPTDPAQIVAHLNWYFTLDRARAAVINVVGLIPRQLGSASERALLASSGWFPGGVP